MLIYLAVGVGGVIGALLRYAISLWLIGIGFNSPAGTLCANLIGCFTLGYVQAILKGYQLPSWFVTGVGTGIIGSFTTFSAFSIDVMQQLSEGRILPACTYILVSSIGGYVLVYIGYKLSTISKRGV